MKSYNFTFRGEVYPLCLNAAALFNIYDKYGDKGSVTDHIAPNDATGFEAVCFYLYELAKQGEIVRRWMGEDRRSIPTQAMFAAMLTPNDIPEAKHAIRQAIALGFVREHDSRESIDMGLVELRKKEAAN